MRPSSLLRWSLAAVVAAVPWLLPAPPAQAAQRDDLAEIDVEAIDETEVVPLDQLEETDEPVDEAKPKKSRAVRHQKGKVSKKSTAAPTRSSRGERAKPKGPSLAKGEKKATPRGDGKLAKPTDGKTTKKAGKGAQGKLAKAQGKPGRASTKSERGAKPEKVASKPKKAPTRRKVDARAPEGREERELASAAKPAPKSVALSKPTGKKAASPKRAESERKQPRTRKALPRRKKQLERYREVDGD